MSDKLIKAGIPEKYASKICCETDSGYAIIDNNISDTNEPIYSINEKRYYAFTVEDLLNILPKVIKGRHQYYLTIQYGEDGCCSDYISGRIDFTLLGNKKHNTLIESLVSTVILAIEYRVGGVNKIINKHEK